MNIYLVTSGEYSDYGVVAVFSSDEKARTFMRDYPLNYPGYNNIEIFELDEPGDKYKKGKRPFDIAMNKDGSTESISYCMNYEGDIIEMNLYYHNEGGTIDFTIQGRNIKEAIKIVNDKRIQLIASGEWDRLLKEQIENQ